MSSPQVPSAVQLAQDAIKEAFAELVTAAEAVLPPIEPVGQPGVAQPDVQQPAAEQPVLVHMPVEPEAPVVAEKRLSKAEIKAEYTKITLPADASTEEVAAFANDQAQFSGLLGLGGDNEAALWNKLLEVRERVRLITLGVAARKAEKEEFAQEFAALDFAAVDPAPTEEKEPVIALGPEIRKLLDLADSYNRVEEIRTQLKRAKQQIAALRENIAKRRKAKAEVLQQLEKLPWASLAAAPDEEKNALKTLREDTERKLVEPLTKDGVEAALLATSGLARQVDELAKEMERRLAQKADMEEAARAIAVPPEAEPDRLHAAKTKLGDELKKPLSLAVLSAAEIALTELRDEAQKVQQEVDKLIARRDMFQKQLDGAVQVSTSAGIKGGEITAKISAAQDILAGMPIRGLDGFPAALKGVRGAVHGAAIQAAQRGSGGAAVPYLSKEQAAIDKEIAGLPAGTQKNALVAKSAEIDKSMSKTLTPKKVGSNLKAVRGLREDLDKAKVAIGAALEEMAGQREFIRSQIAKPDPDDVDRSFADKLTAQRLVIETQLVDPLSPGKLSLAAAETKTFHSLHAQAAQDAIDGQAVAKQLAEIPPLYATIHPASRKPVQAELAAMWRAGQALAALTGASRNMKTALVSLEKLRARLAAVDTENKKAVASKAQLKLAKAGGLPIPEADADEIYDEFGPDAIDELKAGLGNLDSVAALCATFKSGKPGGVAALGALTRDGLGSGQALVALYRDGCGGDAAKLRQFEAAFDSDDDRTNLRGMVDTALGKDASLLNSALKTGCGLDTMPVTKRKDFATASADLKEFCKAFKDDKDQKKLNGLLQNGGIGGHPKVFGSLLKIGCEGDPNNGEDSMDYRAGQLKKLAAAYTNPADQARLKGMMDNGGFGRADCQEVLAHVLKSGCDGDPAKLKNLGNAFKTGEDLGKLNDLLTAGGLGGGLPNGRQDTLGKVLGKGLRYPDTPDKDEPQRLKNLHAAFAGNGGADLAQLKTMVDTFNADLGPIFTTPPPQVAPREEPVPGERFFNLLNKKNMNGNIAKLKTLHDRLDAQSQLVGTEGVSPPPPVPKTAMGRNDLMRNASTIKKTPLSGARPAHLGVGNCVDITSAKMGHFCRHAREHTEFELANKTLVTANLNSPIRATRDLGKRKAKRTTLWPEGITDRHIAEYVDLALTMLGASVPTLATLADRDFVQFDRTIPSTPAFDITIGFERKGPNIEITQFFPRGGPGTEEIVFYDMHAIKEGIV